MGKPSSETATTASDPPAARRTSRQKPACISVDGSLIVVDEGAHRAVLKTAPGAKWHTSLKRWEFLKGPFDALRLFRYLTKQDVNIEGDPLFWELLALSDGVKPPPKVSAGPAFKTDPWEHQAKAHEFALPMPGAMLAMDMGTGKTKVAIDICNTNHHKRILVLCPKSVLRVWPREFEQHSLMKYQVRVLDDTSVAKKTTSAELFCSVMEARKEPYVLVINHESSWRFPFGDSIRRNGRGQVTDIENGFISRVKWDCILVDECHRAKSPTGKFSQHLARIASNAKQVLGLTGTPMPHSPLDIFAQMRFIDPSIFGRSWSWFKRRYAVMGGFEGKQIVGVQNEAELQERFFSRAFRVTADEALDLPGVLWTSHYCDLEPKARKIYDELEAAFYSAVEEGEITAANALVKLIRLHQIASGHIVFDEDDSPTEISRHKYEALIDILEGLDEPVVCFARFRADLRLVEEAAKYLDRRYGEVSGSRKDLNDEARFPKDLDILGVNIQSGGVGVDLTRARVAIYMSCGFSLGDFEQSAKRLDRPGQNHKVLYIRLITNHTIDETIYLALAARKNAVEAVLEAGNEARV